MGGDGEGMVELVSTPGAYRLRYELSVARVGPSKECYDKRLKGLE